MTAFYGKLPARGDFLTRSLSREFINRWDDWLQSGMNASRQALGEAWLDTYLTSPLWRFVLPAGICGNTAFAGVLMPSMDKVGRYFPMTVVRQIDGTGLGLPIVKSLVTLHGGTLALESEPGAGTQAVVRFPGFRLQATSQKVLGASIAAVVDAG